MSADRLRQALIAQKQRVDCALQAPAPTLPHTTASTHSSPATHPPSKDLPVSEGQRKRKRHKRAVAEDAAAHATAAAREAASPSLSKKRQRPSPTSPLASAPSPAPAPAPPSSLSSALSSARFRWLNERLYTSSSADAFAYFSGHPREFTAYHVGFRQQVDKWPQHPLTLIISHLYTLPPSTIADMGCGDALIATTFHPTPHTVHSFDLLSPSPLVTACNIAHTPLAPASVDVAVYCLSLMGMDWAAFVREGWRVLRLGGEMVVAEVASRMKEGGGVEGFIKALEGVGFRRRKLVHNDYFVCAWLVKQVSAHSAGKGKKKGKAPRAGAVQPEEFVLTPCLYKKR